MHNPTCHTDTRCQTCQPSAGTIQADRLPPQGLAGWEPGAEDASRPGFSHIVWNRGRIAWRGHSIRKANAVADDLRRTTKAARIKRAADHAAEVIARAFTPEQIEQHSKAIQQYRAALIGRRLAQMPTEQERVAVTVDAWSPNPRPVADTSTHDDEPRPETEQPTRRTLDRPLQCRQYAKAAQYGPGHDPHGYAPEDNE